MNHWTTESLKWLALVSLLTNIGGKTCKNIFSTATSRAEHFLTANWSLREGDEEVNKRTKPTNYYFRFERQSFFRSYFQILICKELLVLSFFFLLATEEGLSFKPKYWASFFKYRFVVSFFCFLIHPLVVKISLRLKNFLHGLLLWICWYFIFHSSAMDTNIWYLSLEESLVVATTLM